MVDSITIVQPAGSILPAHPKAALRAETGYTLVLRWAPTGADLAGWGVVWSPLDRPGRRPLVARTSDGLPTVSYSILLGGLSHQDSIEPELAALRVLAESGSRVTLVNLSPQEAGPWRIANVSVSASLRQHGTNHFTRAVVSLDLVAAVDVNSAATVVRRYTLKSPTRTIYVYVKKGMTLRSLAYKYYGDPYHWRPIYDKNRLKSTTLKIGRRLAIPVIKLT